MVLTLFLRTVSDEELRCILALAETMVLSWEPLLEIILKEDYQDARHIS